MLIRALSFQMVARNIQCASGHSIDGRRENIMEGPESGTSHEISSGKRKRHYRHGFRRQQNLHFLRFGFHRVGHAAKQRSLPNTKCKTKAKNAQITRNCRFT